MAETGQDAGGADCRPRPPVSFELFPPRSDAAALALGRTIDRLAEADPAFISVTFGAGGSSRERSLTVLRYMLENTDAIVAVHEGAALYIELPASVELTVQHTDPGLQGDRSTGGTKPATLETGAEIQVPLFLTTGEKIKVDTRDGRYLGRVNEK